MVKGRVRWFNELKGYGVIVAEDGSELPVSYASIAGEGFRTLSEGEHVEFEIEEGTKGPQASNVTRVEM